ncbi:Gfo/Idh/MocA family oxidoreductase [bacterium]|nr:Gfo/Idh/MocA family oxidoreductase [bacterium]
MVPSILAQKTARPIRVGQIGTGHAHAAGKWKALRENTDMEVVGLVETHAGRRVAAEQNPVYSGAAWMSMKELLAVDGLRLVAVETEVGELLQTAEACLRRGIHIHLDKPAGSDLAHFERLVALARSQKRIIQMGYMFRYNPAFELCVRAVREGWLGKVFSVEAVMSKKSGDHVRQGLAAFEGGTMFELGCHVIDAIVFLFGKPQKVHAFNRYSRKPADPLADNQLAVLEYPDLVATVRSALIEVDGFARRQLVVCGENGTLEIRPLEPPSVRLTLENPMGGFKRGVQTVEFGKSERYHGDFRDLVLAIRGQKKMAFSLDHDLAVQETVLRAGGML